MPRFSLPKIRKHQPDSVSREPDDGSYEPDSASERPRVRRISLEGFRDPARRPRYLAWTGVAVLVLAAVMIAALGVTSTRWFCSEGCHKVQDDTILAYQRSTHSEVSCMACHMPVGASPVTFVLHKAEALGELYLTVTDNYELPLNPQSHVALEMSSEQCTQCHNLDTRAITPASGIIIDHDVHSEEGFDCAVCHNRIAHNEDFTLTLKDPSTGEPNQKHEEFMSMTACFRCHDQETDGKAPGTCEACHPPEFELKPASHLEEGFYPEGHADMAMAEASRTAEATGGVESEAHEPAEAEESEGGGHGEALELPTVASIDYCSTCHLETFCNDCHGLPMPHPEGFNERHGTLGGEDPESCETCHGGAQQSCDGCHHGTSMDLPYDGSQGPWIDLHPLAVGKIGANACYECHDPTYCAHCHVRVVND